VEKFQLAMAFINQAQQFPGSPLEAKGMELLAEAMELDPKFLDPPLLLGMMFFDSDPVKHAKAIVECASRAHLIDMHHREAAGFLADVLQIPECREHFLDLAQGSYEADEIDDFITDLRYEAEG
jgi:hypothetical protein